MEKLFEALRDSGQYTKSFSDFQSQFGSQEGQEKLYGALKESGSYTKTFGDFTSQFFNTAEPVKTNDSASADPAVESNQNATGSKSEDGSLGSQPELTTWQSIKNSLSNVAENFDDVLEFWGDDGGKDAAKDIATNAIYSSIFGQKNLENKDAFIGGDIGAENTLNALKRYEEDQKEMKQTKGIIESYNKGDYGGMVAGAVNAVTNGFGSMVYGIGTGFMGYMADFTARNYAEYNKQKAENLGISLEELVKSGEAETVVPVALGTANMAAEVIGDAMVAAAVVGTRGKIKGPAAFAVRKLPKQLLNKIMYNKKAKAALTIFGTGVGEFATEITQHGTDAVNDELGRVAGTKENSKAIEAFYNAITSEEGLEAGLQGLVGAGGMVGGSYSIKAMNSVRQTVDGDMLDKNLESLSAKQLEFAKATDETVKEGIQAEIDAIEENIANQVIRGNKIYNSLTNGQISELESYSDLADAAAYKITELNKKRRLNQISESEYNVAKQGFESQYNSAKQSISDMKLNENIDFLKTTVKKEGFAKDIEATVLNSTLETKAAMENLSEVDKANKQEYFDSAGNVAGFTVGGKIFVNKEAARNTGQINVAKHEFLHKIINAKVGGVKAQEAMVKGLRRALSSKQRKIVDQALLNRDYKTKQEFNTEYVQVLSDLIATEKISFEKSALGKMGDAIKRFFVGNGFEKISFEDSKGVLNFIKDYSKNTKELSTEAKQAIGDTNLAEEGNLQFSKTQLENTKKKLSEIPADQVQSAVNRNKIGAELPSMIGTQINNRFSNLDPSTREEFTFDVLEKILRPNKQGVNKDLQWDGRGDLYGFLNGRIGLRIRDAVREDYNRPEAERMYVGRIDAKQIEDLTKEPSTEPTTEPTPKKKSTTSEESVERGQATFDELDIVDDDLVKDIKSELEKEIRVRVQKGTLSETVSVKKGRNTYIVSWLEDYINKQLFKKLLKKVGAISGTYPDTVIPPAYIDFLQDPKTFDIITKALPIKSIKKSYSKLFEIERIGREVTAEGNPIFRIKKIDKTKFFKYFVDGKKSTILERQKQLFREILTPVTKQIVADIATVDNLSSLKEIQSLAPSQSVDVVNSIAIEAQLNELESQIDRYKGEKTGFDIIQFSKSLSKEDKAAISKKLGYKSDGVIAMAQLAAQIISQTISPTRRKYNKSLKSIEEKLGPELWEKVWKNTLKDYTNILDSFKAKQEYTNGVLAEQVVWDVFSKTPGIKVISKRPGDKSGDTSADIIIKHKQKEYIFEIKYNKTSRITSTNIKNYHDSSKMETTREIGEESNKIVMDAIKNSKPLQSFISKVDKFMAKNYPGENYITDSGYIELTPKQYEELNLGDSLYKESVTYINGLNEKMVEAIYNGKDTHYIGFLDIGTFHVGENIAGLPIPKFEGDLFTRAWLKKGAPKANGKMTFILKMYAQLTTPAADALAEGSTMSIISSDSINSNFKRIQFSKSKPAWDPFDMRDVVTMALFGKTKAFKNKQRFERTYKYLTPSQQKQVQEEMKNHKLLQFSKTINKAKAMINRPDAPQKGISVWDFDDTLATTKSNVLYTLPNGTRGKINATEFALQADSLEKQGAEFDFSEFSKVMKGAKGPMFDKAIARNKKFGNDNVFILTARPANSKYAIHEFLKGIGLDIKLENIVGLGDGTALAKAQWVVGKVAEGYNDFYFADDAYKNVKAVQGVLEEADVKSKVHQAKVQFSKNLNKDFNDIIQDVTGVSSSTKVFEAASKVIGKTKDKFKFFVPYSAEDFVGLLYPLMGKGKQGDAHAAWFKEALLDPYAKGYRDFESYKQNATAIVKQLVKSFKDVPSGLEKTNSTGFTNEMALRVILWAKNGHEIPGLSKQERSDLIKVVQGDQALLNFAKQIQSTLGGYPEPTSNWYAGTITTDAINMINTSKRAEFLEAWQQNVDVVFSKDNMNKLRLQFGENYTEALEDMLYRMKTGRNRPIGANKLTNNFMNWVNDSVGTIMFFNTRSALLQTLSIVNFVNWGDNNPIAAAEAFANQDQFWKDFSMLFNSDFLKQRRSGLKNDVNADDIARAAETATNKYKAALSAVLKAGFLPTQIADSFAIAMGGASFVRNRINTYVSQGMSEKQAKEKALLEFQEIAEETQQSSRPDRVSQQQASPLGRIILAFANTPMQYMRLTKKAVLDLKNRRGDDKTNITKIIYYTTVQNMIFSSLQSAMFAALFEDDDEEMIEDKQLRAANSMLDSLLRGTGVYGAIASTIKNILFEVNKQSKKDRPDYTQAGLRMLSISPPVDSKIRKVLSTGRAFSYKTTREKMVGFGLDNPAFYAIGQSVSAFTNIPLDRVIRKMDNVRMVFSDETKYWQKVALLLGYSQWDLGLVQKKDTPNKFGKTSKWKKR